MLCDIHIIHLVFFFNDTATTEIYTLSLHDALPIGLIVNALMILGIMAFFNTTLTLPGIAGFVLTIGADRKSTRLNSSHTVISYAVFCLKKKKKSRLRTQGYSCRKGGARRLPTGMAC